MQTKAQKALILSVGYGAGHHAAAGAVAESMQNRGWSVRVEDPCALAHPQLFQLTRRFYHFCVRTAPWLWAVTYDLTNTADWGRRAFSPVLRGVTEAMLRLLEEMQPDVVVCTYPLFAHMMDALQETHGISVPYAVVVTDSLEISRPWLVNRSPLIFLPDEYSYERVVQRYALSDARLKVSGFPVRSAFKRAAEQRPLPHATNLNIVYGAYAPLPRVRRDLDALLAEYPQACITVIAGERAKRLQRYADAGMHVIESTGKMDELFAKAHIYIGKAGAATVFEAYAARLPVLINYALPGQEQGNTELILRDGTGSLCLTTAELIGTIERMLNQGAAGWQKMSDAMGRLARADGAERIADALEKHVMYE